MKKQQHDLVKSEPKQHVKSKKEWVYGSLLFLGISGAIIISGQPVAASDKEPVATEQVSDDSTGDLAPSTLSDEKPTEEKTIGYVETGKDGSFVEVLVGKNEGAVKGSYLLVDKYIALSYFKDRDGKGPVLDSSQVSANLDYKIGDKIGKISLNKDQFYVNLDSYFGGIPSQELVVMTDKISIDGELLSTIKLSDQDYLKATFDFPKDNDYNSDNVDSSTFPPSMPAEKRIGSGVSRVSITGKPVTVEYKDKDSLEILKQNQYIGKDMTLGDKWLYSFAAAPNTLNGKPKSEMTYNERSVNNVISDTISQNEGTITVWYSSKVTGNIIPTDPNGNPIPGAEETPYEGMPGETIEVSKIPGYTASTSTVTIPENGGNIPVVYTPETSSKVRGNIIPTDPKGNPIPGAEETPYEGMPGETIEVSKIPGYTASTSTVTIP
ncbi:hypothetical protein ACWOCD_16070, partial [Enterococcus silesiacus]